jgi:hypothetical protein
MLLIYSDNSKILSDEKITDKKITNDIIDLFAQPLCWTSVNSGNIFRYTEAADNLYDTVKTLNILMIKSIYYLF